MPNEKIITLDNLSTFKNRLDDVLDARLATKQPKDIVLTDTAVSSWSSNSDPTYIYQALINVTSYIHESSRSIIPEVIFDLAEATSGNYAPVSTYESDGTTAYIRIYSKVNTSITIPTIIIHRD